MSAAVTSLGLLGVFLLMVPESACVPIPSEATLLAAGAGVQHGWFSFPLAVLAATAGNVAGSLLAYAVGRRLATWRLARADSDGMLRSGRLLRRWGDAAVFVARLLPLARTFISLPAGAARIPLGRFVLFTAAGCAIWSAGFIGAASLAAP